MRVQRICALLAALAAAGLAGEKMTDEHRVELLRGLTAEFATVKSLLPRSKKPLPFRADGTWDKKKWEELAQDNGPAARVGDQVQITKVTFHDTAIELQINGGFRSGPKWYERVEVGMGRTTTPVGRGGNAPGGTTVLLEYGKKLEPTTAAEVKKLLAPVLDFEKRSATENYLDNLPEPVKAAILQKRAVEGMDREQVLMALGRPRTKTRETQDGEELEDWIYGQPPGKITFVTFHNGKVVKVRDSYAGLGGSTADPLPPP